jgi:peptidoglycan/LPS O-acetylase OafA/YrhL
MDTERPRAAAPSLRGAVVSRVERSRQNRFVFLDIMRGIAPVLVIYSHVVALFLNPHKLDSPVVDLLSEQFRDPLRLEQQMGHFAVVMFFLVSGFIITQVGTQESHREFGVKRLFRIYPLLIVTVGLTAILSIWHLQVLRTGQHFEITTPSVLTNMALANYFMVPQVILVGVAWTLVIEVVFYTIVMSLLAVLRRWTWVAIVIELGLVLAGLLLAREFGSSFFLLAVNLSYLPVVLLGQVTWAVWSGRVPLWAGTLLGFACWTLYVLGDIRNMGRLDDAYNSTFALGFGLFLALLLAESRLRPTKPISFLADRSYSLYLLHGPVAFPVMENLRGVVPVWLAVLAGLVLTVAAAEVTFRFVEQPGQRIGRRLTRRFRLPRPKAAEPVREEPAEDVVPAPAVTDRIEPTRPPRPARPPARRQPVRPQPAAQPARPQPAWPSTDWDGADVPAARRVPSVEDAFAPRVARPAPPRPRRPPVMPPREAPPVHGFRPTNGAGRGEIDRVEPNSVPAPGRHRRND